MKSTIASRSRNGATGYSYSAARWSGSRLVTSSFRLGSCADSVPTLEAAASSCSKLSRTSSSRRSEPSSVTVSPVPSARAIVGTTRSGSRSACSGTQTTPSGKCSTASAASWSARRVFPEPPGPVRVTSRCARRRPPASWSSSSRPISGVGGTGRFVLGAAGGGDLAVMARSASSGSWRRIFRSSSCRSGEGSRPSSSASASRAAR